VFAEIFVTTAGGPGLASTNLAFLIYRYALLEYRRRRRVAGGVLAIVLATSSLLSWSAHRKEQRGLTAMDQSLRRKIIAPAAAWAVALLIFFPIL